MFEELLQSLNLEVIYIRPDTTDPKERMILIWAQERAEVREKGKTYVYYLLPVCSPYCLVLPVAKFENNPEML